MVTIYIQVYNAVKYIEKCLCSVISQSYKEFECIVYDNGSSDGSTEIIKEFSKKDNRIILIRNDVNENYTHIFDFFDIIHGKYVTILDSDDWLEQDYLKILVNIAEETHADIVNTGSVMHEETTGLKSTQILKSRLAISKSDYPYFFPVYHWFYRQLWGMLIKTDIIKAIEFRDIRENKMVYGADTILSFRMLRLSNNICVDNSALHHYLISQKSISRTYNPTQSLSNLYLYNDAVSFLSSYGPISNNNNAFLYCIYLNSIDDTLKNLNNADLTCEQKAAELYKIIKCVVTKKALVFERISTNTLYKRLDTDFANGIKEASGRVSFNLFGAYIKYCSQSKEISQEYIDVFEGYFINCKNIVQKDNLAFWAENPKQQQLLLRDDKIGLICSVADLIYQKKITKTCDVESIINRLVEDDNMLTHISNNDFIRNHHDVYILIVKKDYKTALDKMTFILNYNKTETDDKFFWLYITLAALLEKTDEFLYGKLCFASYQLHCKKYDECRAELNELSEMGVDDNDEIFRIKNELKKVGK